MMPAAAIAAIRAALEPNPLCESPAHALRLMREDVAKILDAWGAAIGEQARPSYCPDCGTPTTEHCEKEAKNDE